MALFSRRKKDVPDAETPAGSDHTPAADTSAPAEAPAPEPAGEAVPDVPISVSTFRGAGAGAAPTEPAAPKPAADATDTGQTPRVRGRASVLPAEPPAPTETISGMRDNVLVQQALARISDPATPEELLEVMRQMLQGHLFLRVKGDARALLAENQPLPLAIARRGEDQFVLAFSSGQALQAAVAADGDAQTSAVGQPILTVLRNVLAGPYAGLLLDGSSEKARAVIPRTVIEQAVSQADERLWIKTLLATHPRTPEITARVAEALRDTRTWVALNQAAPDSDGKARVGVAEARTREGQRYIEVYSHPIEVIAMGRGDRAAALTPQQLARTLMTNPGVDGVIVDPAGPSLRLSRDDLAQVIERAAEPEEPAEGSAPTQD